MKFNSISNNFENVFQREISQIAQLFGKLSDLKYLSRFSRVKSSHLTRVMLYKTTRVKSSHPTRVKSSYLTRVKSSHPTQVKSSYLTRMKLSKTTRVKSSYLTRVKTSYPTRVTSFHPPHSNVSRNKCPFDNCCDT